MALRDQVFRDLHRVPRRALEELVAAHEEGEAVALEEVEPQLILPAR